MIKRILTERIVKIDDRFDVEKIYPQIRRYKLPIRIITFAALASISWIFIFLAMILFK